MFQAFKDRHVDNPTGISCNACYYSNLPFWLAFTKHHVLRRM